MGNAKSIFDFKNGLLIDIHEVVIRFNRGIPMEPPLFGAMGRRTTILAGFRFNRRQWEMAHKPVIFYRGWFNKPAAHREWPDVEEWRAEKHREDTISKHLNRKGPSNGVMLLEVLVNLFKPKVVRIFGFDFFKTKSWYPGNASQIGGGRYHDGMGEEDYIKNVLGFKYERPGVFVWKNS